MTERYAHKSTERMKANSQKLSLKNVATVSSVTPPQKMAIKINDFQGIMVEAKGFEYLVTNNNFNKLGPKKYSYGLRMAPPNVANPIPPANLDSTFISFLFQTRFLVKVRWNSPKGPIQKITGMDSQNRQLSHSQGDHFDT
jgi:hypothetical protein